MDRALLSLVAAASLALSGAAAAYNVYNKTTDPTSGSIEVWGEHCMQCFHAKVKQGQHKSCPGNDKGCGGHTQITACVLAPGWGTNQYALRACAVKVPAHGWVEFVERVPGFFDDQTTEAFVGCIVYDENGRALNTDNKMDVVYGYNPCPQ